MASLALTARFMITWSICVWSAEQPRSGAGTYQIDILADETPQQFRVFLNHLIEVHHDGLEDLLAAEGEQL